MNLKFLIVTLLLLFTSLPLHAEDGNNFDALFGGAYILIRVAGFLSGLILAFLGLKKLIDYAGDSRNPKNSPLSSLIMFFAAGLLLNINASLSVFINTLNNSGGYCFYGDLSGNSDTIFGNNSSCFAEAKSITKDLANELQKQTENTESVKKLEEKLRMLFTLFQLVGLIYFIKGIYMLKAASEGSQQASYMKILFMIIASCLVIDMPHTIKILINTISTWNKI